MSSYITHDETCAGIIRSYEFDRNYRTHTTLTRPTSSLSRRPPQKSPAPITTLKLCTSSSDDTSPSCVALISIMSKLFRSPHSLATPTASPDHDHHSAYSSLLSQQSQDRPSPPDYQSRPWLTAVEGRSSWTGERPATRKLVKDMNGSGRPSFSLELSDSDAEKEKGIVTRQIARLLKELYRREK